MKDKNENKNKTKSIVCNSNMRIKFYIREIL